MSERGEEEKGIQGEGCRWGGLTVEEGRTKIGSEKECSQVEEREQSAAKSYLQSGLKYQSWRS